MKPSFMQAMRATFGTPNQPPIKFGQEIKELSSDDRKWYSEQMNIAGIEHNPPAEAGVAAA